MAMLDTVQETHQIDTSEQISGLEICGWALIGALLSLLVTGFVLGASNNLFHFSIVGALFDEPQYRDDAFTQSLRYFASGVWLLLRGVDKYVDLYWLFLGLNLLSRFLTVVGFLLCAGLLGIRSRIDVALFTVLLSACSLMYGGSYAGAGGMFVKMFSHSEMANGLALLALNVMARGAIAASFALNGAVFFVNAFVAVWNAVPFGFVVADKLLRRKLKLSRAIIEIVIGVAVFMLIAAPVLLNIAANPDMGRPLGFDYVTFLRGYYPFHFLVDDIPPFHFVAAGLVVLLGFLSFGILGRQARVFSLMLAGYVTVYLIGAVVPNITHNPLVLNLHLLRVSTFFHLLATLGVVTVMTQWLRSADLVRARLLAPALVLVTCTARHGALIAPYILLASFWTRSLSMYGNALVVRARYSRAMLLVAAVVGLAITVNVTWRDNRSLTDWIAEWTAIGQWARVNTPAEAVFMVPTIDFFVEGRNGSTFSEVAEVGSATFELMSHRRVWVDFRRGAAVMWSGSYHDEWRSRLDQQVKLGSLDERIAFASNSKISYVVDICSADNAARASFRTSRLCVFDAG